MTELTATRALELLEEVVAEKGEDYVYQQSSGGCFYLDVNDHTKPGCLVGHVLVRHGIAPLALSELDRAEYGGVTAGILNEYCHEVSAEAGHVLNAAQDVQDRQKPWGDALDAARAAYATLDPQ